MKKESRHHHYIPQFYLRGFLPVGQKKPMLTVLDVVKQRVFTTNTRNVGGIRDFNRINADGIVPDSLESSLSFFDGQAATALKKFQEQHSFANKEVFDVILKLIALLAVRHPLVRANYADTQTQITKMVMKLIVANKECYESAVRNAKKDGIEIDDNVSYEQVKEFCQRGEYEIDVPNESHINVEFGGVDAVLPYLFGRGWTLYIADDNAGPFVTCDRPVILEWNEPEKLPPSYRNCPGFGMGETSVIFPVSQKMILIGEFGIPNSTFEVNRKFVSVMNSKVMYYARPQIYAPDLSFGFFDTKRKKIRHGSKLFTPNTG